MRKQILYCFLLIISSTMIHAQIPNNGFENWITVGKGSEPAYWYSFYSLIDTNGTYFPISKSTDHYPESIGKYSVRITNDTALWKSGVMPTMFLGWGILMSTKENDKPLFPISGHPTSLHGYYKYSPINGDSMSINIFLYKNGKEISSGGYKSGATVSTWTSFNVTLSTYGEVDSARISFAAALEEKKGGGGVHGNSVLYLDNLSFDNLIVADVQQTDKNTPNKFTLSQNYPNPFNPTTMLRYHLPAGQAGLPVNSKVSLKIYDLLGREIATLVNEEQLAGWKEVQWNAKDVSSGIYFYKLTAGSFTATKRMILVK